MPKEKKVVEKKKRNHWGELKLPLIIILVMRIGGFLYMYIDPITGILLSFLFDCLDAFTLYLFGVPYSGYYHKIDKRLDYLQYIMVLPIAWQYPIFPYVLGALIYRSIGDLIVLYTGKRYFFVIFTNVVEYILLIYLVILKYNLPFNWNDPIVLLCLLLFKLTCEMIVHVLPIGRQYWKPFTWVPQIRKWKD